MIAMARSPSLQPAPWAGRSAEGTLVARRHLGQKRLHSWRGWPSLPRRCGACRGEIEEEYCRSRVSGRISRRERRRAPEIGQISRNVETSGPLHGNAIHRMGVTGHLTQTAGDPEAAAAAFCRQADGIAAVTASDVEHQGEAEPAAAAGLAAAGQAIEGLEDALSFRRRHAGPMVGDFQDSAPGLRCDRDGDRPVAGVAPRVLQKIADQAAQQRRSPDTVTDWPVASRSKRAASSAASARRSTGSRCSSVGSASSRLAKRICSINWSSSSTSCFSDSRVLASAPSPSSDAATAMRASGVRNSWLQLASSIRLGADKLSMRRPTG